MDFRKVTAVLAGLPALIVAVALAAAPIGARADQTPATPTPTPRPQERWHADVTPYLWLPTIKGDLNFTIPSSGSTFGLTVTPSKYVPKLASALMVTGGVRKGNWGALGDLIYLNLTGITNGVTSVTGPDGMETIPINTNMQGRFTSAIVTAGGTYNVLPSEPGNLDAVLGARFISANASVSWNFSGPFGLFPIAGSHSENVNLWDGIVGVRGKFAFSNSKWFAPFYADIGTGDAPLTWQVVGAIGQQSHSNAWEVGYRNLYYNMGSGKLLHNINLGGPIAGYTFKF